MVSSQAVLDLPKSQSGHGGPHRSILYVTQVV